MNRAVIFDLDGTLLNSLRDLAAAGNHVLCELGYAPHDVQDYRQMAGSGIPVLVERMLQKAGAAPQLHSTALSAFRSYYEAHHADLTLPYEGVIQVLDVLRAGGVRTGVLSNKDEVLARQLCSRFFAGRLDLVCGLREGAAPKPCPDLLLQMLARLSCPRHSAVYVGDSDVDMFTAQRAGVHAVGVLWGFRSRQELTAAGAKQLCEAPHELVAAVQALSMQ